MSATMAATIMSYRCFVRSQRHWQNVNLKVWPTYRRMYRGRPTYRCLTIEKLVCLKIMRIKLPTNLITYVSTAHWAGGKTSSHKWCCLCWLKYLQIIVASTNILFVVLAGAGTGHNWTWLTPESRVCTAPPSYALPLGNTAFCLEICCQIYLSYFKYIHLPHPNVHIFEKYFLCIWGGILHQDIQYLQNIFNCPVIICCATQPHVFNCLFQWQGGGIGSFKRDSAHQEKVVGEKKPQESISSPNCELLTNWPSARPLSSLLFGSSGRKGKDLQQC